MRGGKGFFTSVSRPIWFPPLPLSPRLELENREFPGWEKSAIGVLVSSFRVTFFDPFFCRKWGGKKDFLLPFPAQSDFLSLPRLPPARIRKSWVSRMGKSRERRFGFFFSRNLFRTFFPPEMRGGKRIFHFRFPPNLISFPQLELENRKFPGSKN